MNNPDQQLGGVWTDPSPVPTDIVTLGLAQNLVDDPIADEWVKAATVTDADNFLSNQDGWNDAQGTRTATSAPGRRRPGT